MTSLSPFLNLEVPFVCLFRVISKMMHGAPPLGVSPFHGPGQWVWAWVPATIPPLPPPGTMPPLFEIARGPPGQFEEVLVEDSPTGEEGTKMIGPLNVAEKNEVPEPEPKPAPSAEAVKGKFVEPKKRTHLEAFPATPKTRATPKPPMQIPPRHLVVAAAASEKPHTPSGWESTTWGNWHSRSWSDKNEQHEDWTANRRSSPEGLKDNEWNSGDSGRW